MKKTIILATAMLLAISASADRRTIKDRSENWLQREQGDSSPSHADETSTGDLRIGAAPNAPTVPVGEGLLVLSALVGAYAVYKKQTKHSTFKL
ncbi:MAG: hypothetical protein LBS25_02180 [Candidatus Symbiothrix sp.]|jgi:hypothetical protein|nr:hypothetical protein [Candidatus Symbiothrix sp.]